MSTIYPRRPSGNALLTRRETLLGSAALAALSFGLPRAHARGLSAEEAPAIAKEAYIYGFPLVDSYRIQHSCFVDAKVPEYKGAWSELRFVRVN